MSITPKVAEAKNRFQTSLKAASAFILAAKTLHDELETNYIPAMDFDRIEAFRTELVGRLLEELEAK